MARCIVLAGNYGSGKTEISLNLSIACSQKGKTVLVDMDIVNPYFRSAEHKSMLAEKGIRLIAPTFANTAVDVPAISAEVFAAFSYDYAVFDAGGDPVGASVLGSIRDRFEGQELQFYYVVNARRPLQRTAEEIVGMMQLIEGKARMRVTALINNTNLARETTAEDLLFGRDICKEVSRLADVPVAFTSGEAHILEEYAKKAGDASLLPLQIFTRPGWLDSTV